MVKLIVHQKSLFWRPKITVKNCGGHLFLLPMSIDKRGEECCDNYQLRRNLLLGSGIKEGSENYNMKMEVKEENGKKSFVRRIKICKCHISDEDIIAGTQDETLQLK